MIEMGIYSVLDKKGERYDTPFICMTDLNAKRHFTMMIRKNGTVLSEFKDDMELHQIGRFNALTGEITFDKRHLLDGKAVLKTNQEE